MTSTEDPVRPFPSSTAPELDEDLKVFLRAFTHDISNPLTSVLGYCQLLERETDPERIREHIAVIADQTRQCRRRIDNVQQFVDPDKARCVSVLVNDVVRYAMGFQRTRCDAHNIEVHLELEPDLPPILGDVRLIRLAIGLLLDNAITALEAVQTDRRLILRTWIAPTGIGVEIEDNGCGFDGDHWEPLFDPHYTTRGRARGLGLGLPTVQSIMDRHRGAVRLEHGAQQGVIARLEFTELATKDVEGRAP
jgi:signal transduction histidine kinase